MKRSKIPKQLLTISLAIAIIFANFTMPVQTFAEASVTPEAAMENYLNEKIITSGGENVVKKDNLTYDIGLKTTSNSPINSVRFRDASDGYKAAWKVDPSSAEYLNAKALYTAPSKSILKRPAADEGAFPAKVTVMLYEESTSKSDINSGAAAPLASQDVTINLLPDNPVYNVTFEAVNSKTKKPVTNAVIKVEKDWNTVTPEEGGIYKMTAGDVFNVTAEAPGYKKYINSSFTATASGKVSLPIDEIITKNITFNVKDEKGTPVKNPEITVKKGGSRISAQSDGTYKLEVGQKYSYTITADGFNDVTDTITLSETSSETIEVEMTAAVFHKVTFKISDKKGPVTGAGITVREGYNDVSPESDGSYMLKEGIEYKYTVNKSGYETKTESFTVTENTEISVVLSKTIYKYLVNINPVDSQGKTISNATVKVEYYDDYDWEYYEVEPESGTTYELYPSTEYTISVSAPGYTSKTISSYTPSGDDEEIDYKITLIKKESPDQGKVDAVKKQFDNELGALRPSFKTDPNINTFVLNKIKGYSGLDTSGITVELASADSNVIGTDGTIHYITNSLNPYGGVNSENVSCTFKIKCGSAEAVTLSRTVTVGWDQNYFNEKIKADRDSMTIDRILGSNKDKNNITSDLTLPR